jgi:photosystem II stability/assembly factor-like uncharacterized protein
MTDSDEFTPGEGKEWSQRVIQDLHRMYHTEIEDAQPFARVRKRLEEGNASTLYNSTRTPQQHDILSTRRGRSGNKKSARSSFSEGATWQQRISTLAAALFVALLVGTLLFVLTHAHQSSSNGAGNILTHFEALSSIRMIDATTGWAVTEKGRIIRTTDGGMHWKDVTPKYPPTFPIPSQQSVVAHFQTSTIAWAAASDVDTSTVLIFRTSDGGQTWQDTSIQTARVTRITFIDSQHGWLLSKYAVSESAETIDIFRTTDGGKIWAKVSSALAASTDTPPPGHLPFGGTKTGLSFLNATTGWVTGSFPVDGYVLLYGTHDGGSTWDRQTLPLSPGEASSHLSILPPVFFTATDGLLPVSSGTGNGSSVDFYVTHDGGTTWKGTTPVAAAANIADFIDVNHGWASDGTLLYMTNDGGQHWSKLSPGPNFKNISLLNFVSSDIGWAVRAPASNSPSLLKTVDGGHTWTVISSTIS